VWKQSRREAGERAAALAMGSSTLPPNPTPTQPNPTQPQPQSQATGVGVKALTQLSTCLSGAVFGFSRLAKPNRILNFFFSASFGQ
jgi:hypothetical protein